MNVQLSKPFAAYVATPAGKEMSKKVARLCGWDTQEIHSGGLAAAARLADAWPLAGIVLVEVGKMPLAQACESVAEIAKFGSEVLVFAQDAPPDAYRLFRRAGAEDFFTFPVEISDVIHNVKRRRLPEIKSPEPTAQVIGVISGRGGAGGSLLATNLAAIAAEDASKSVAIIDLDLRFGSLSTDLNQEFTSGLFEALSAPDRIDRTFLEATMASVLSNLVLYSGQVGLDQDSAAYEAALEMLVSHMAPMFDIIVLDIPREIAVRRPELLNALSHIIVALPPGFSGLNAFSRLAAHCAQHASAATVFPVLSEARQDANISRKELAKALKTDLRHVLPRSDAQIAKAQIKGKPLATLMPRARFSKSVRALWKELSADWASARTVGT